MKREEFYKLIKVYEKIKEVRTFRHNIFILQYCNNFPSDNNNNEENKIKNNLEQCKSDLMEIKFNMLSKKRKHEESLNDIIKKDFDNSKDDNIINNNDENNVIEENEDKGQKIKKDKKNKKEEKKDFEENEVNSIKKEDILEEKNKK